MIRRLIGPSPWSLTTLTVSPIFAVKKHLEELGFVAGDTVTIVSSLNGNVIVKVKESRVAISEEMARKIMV